ncbi:hypothetical protein EXIGLDRAFT_723974 [Exidia glandulosa HHB12029]|uniref:3'-5' exonuclease n=1 Tax=Exidia glandulosa HHB12029 TaxID=1314781 RepID=A0A165ELH7_EXIGL|nr:hypothetical protein EXIGLDRAFT_723974 [Exidia glandulosa HHB12029]
MRSGGPYGFDIEWRPNYAAGMPENRVALVQIASREVVLLAQVIAMPTFPRVLKALLESEFLPKVGVGIQSDAVKLYHDYGVVMRHCVDVGLLALILDPLCWETPPPPPRPTPPEAEASTSASHDDSFVSQSSVGDSTMDVDDDNKRGRNGKKPRPPKKPYDPNAPRPLSQPGLARLIGVYAHMHLEKPKRIQRSNWELILSPEHQEYAANDADAGRAIYAALRELALTLTPPDKPDPRSPQFFSFDIHTGNVFFRTDEAYLLVAPRKEPLLPLPAPITSVEAYVTFPSPSLRQPPPLAPDVFPTLGGHTIAPAPAPPPASRPNHGGYGDVSFGPRHTGRGSAPPQGAGGRGYAGALAQGGTSRGQPQPRGAGGSRGRGGGPYDRARGTGPSRGRRPPRGRGRGGAASAAA